MSQPDPDCAIASFVVRAGRDEDGNVLVPLPLATEQFGFVDGVAYTLELMDDGCVRVVLAQETPA